jgi:hypothetical protein
MNLIKKIKMLFTAKKRLSDLSFRNLRLEVEILQLKEINDNLEILCDELNKQNKELRAQIDALNTIDAEALKLLQQELDLIFIENMEPIGEA